MSAAVFCEECRDTGLRNAGEVFAADAAAEDARELGGRGPRAVTAVPCDCCPSCDECGRLVREHTRGELRRGARIQPGGLGRDRSLWDVFGCMSRRRPPAFRNVAHARLWISAQDCRRGGCDADCAGDPPAYHYTRCGRHDRADELAERLVRMQRRRARRAAAPAQSFLLADCEADLNLGGMSLQKQWELLEHATALEGKLGAEGAR